MKNISLYLLTIILMASCQKNEEMIMSACDYTIEITAPAGLSIKELNTIDFNGGLNEVQFLSNNIGYVLGHNNIGGYAEIFKTNDGGNNWIDLNLSIKENPINMYFLNEDVGFISHYGENGALLKTSDQGLTWEQLSYEELNGNIYHIQSDSDNNLYAILAGLDIETVLIKSIDEADNWQVINNSGKLDFSLLTFSFKVEDDKIFISGEDGKVIKTDLEGNEIIEIETGLDNIWDFEIIDENNIVIAGGNKAIKSNDGGLNWIEIYDRSARIIDFKNSEEGIMILNLSYCPTDVYQATDVFAYTQNGGLNWEKGNETTNLKLDYSGTYSKSTLNHILVIGNGIYELKE